MNTYFRKIWHWYFTRRALPFWALFLFDSLIVYLTGFLVRQQFVGALATLGDFSGISLTLLLSIVCYSVGFRIFRTYAGLLRYSSFIDLIHITKATVVGTGLTFLIHYPLAIYGEGYFNPLTGREILIAGALNLLFMWLLRVGVKILYESTEMRSDAQRVFIYGIREGGVGLAKSLRADQNARFRLCGFVTDEKIRTGRMLLGVHVYPLDDDLIERMRDQRVTVLLVSPKKTEDFIANVKLQEQLLDADIRIRIVPGAKEWKDGTGGSYGKLREVKIEDLLSRNEIEVDMQSIAAHFANRRVLITGSAGSIGSEIVRQVASMAPAQMVLIDQAETPQHDIRLMMHQEFPNVPATTMVASICNKERMEQVFKTFKPHYVFHAAAYKHVPMLEDNPSESIYNNLYGTKVLADLSVKYGTEKFVMISTDKAVNPTSVMGCSKRLCEIYVQSLNKAISEGKRTGKTQFVTTRFGNVLGSNGSVIPLFRRQIDAGGPITVTHPDMIRFFMLIPEACKLVLEAGTKGKGGEIFVFDMGKPVRIADLARRMIQLSGAKGIEIKYTGLRDGEKLYEEVLCEEERAKPTFHEKIRIASVREYDIDDVDAALHELFGAATQYDDMQTVGLMKRIVPEYKSNHSKYEALDGASAQE